MSEQVKTSKENNFDCVVSAESRYEVRDGFRRTTAALDWSFRGISPFVSYSASADRDRRLFTSGHAGCN